LIDARSKQQNRKNNSKVRNFEVGAFIQKREDQGTVL
jgi:hypothetical protein